MLKNLLNLFYPQICYGCKGLLQPFENVICLQCRHEIPTTLHAKQIENELYKSFYGKITLQFAGALFYYTKESKVQELIHGLKYKNQQKIGSVFGNWFAEELLENEIIKNIDYILPVPLYKKKEQKRGYNQVTTFCLAFSEKLNIPFEDKLLVRLSQSISQSKKNREDRLNIDSLSFELNKNAENFKNKHFLLVDDVITTGATIEACGKKILQIEGAKLSVISIAFSNV